MPQPDNLLTFNRLEVNITGMFRDHIFLYLYKQRGLLVISPIWLHIHQRRFCIRIIIWVQLIIINLLY